LRIVDNKIEIGWDNPNFCLSWQDIQKAGVTFDDKTGVYERRIDQERGHPVEAGVQGPGQEQDDNGY